MVGNAKQFSSFRAMFQSHLAASTEAELEEIQERLAVLAKDVILRQSYLRRIHPEALIRKEQSNGSALFFVPEVEKSHEKAESGQGVH